MAHLNASNLFNVNGLVAVITGGSSGIGAMVARALDANGADAVYIVGRRKEKLEEVAKSAINKSIIPIVGDVTSKESLAQVASQVQSEKGYINVLFANSGIGGIAMHKLLPQGRKPTVKEFKDAMWGPSMEEFTQPLHVNATAVFYTALAFLELLDAGNQKRNVSQKSQIVVTSSIAGYSRAPALGFSYSTSKAAVTALSKQLNTYFIPFMIRVNTIAPGIYPSEMTQVTAAPDGERQPWDEGAKSMEQIPLTRTGSEEDMAGATLFLMSKAGAFISGNSLVTDGGRLSQVPSTYN